MRVHDHEVKTSAKIEFENDTGLVVTVGVEDGTGQIEFRPQRAGFNGTDEFLEDSNTCTMTEAEFEAVVSGIRQQFRQAHETRTMFERDHTPTIVPLQSA